MVCVRQGAMTLGIAAPTGSLADASPAPQGAFQALGHCSPAGPATGAPLSTALLPVTGFGPHPVGMCYMHVSVTCSFNSQC